MRKYAALLTAIVLSTAAPLASADTAQLELLPKVDGVEMTQYVPNEVSSPAANASDAIFFAHTGGVSPQ
jgi:hypothetical protein